jgi:hypothetical protein
MVSVQSNLGNVSYRINLAGEIESFFQSKGKHYLQIPYINFNKSWLVEKINEIN